MRRSSGFRTDVRPLISHLFFMSFQGIIPPLITPLKDPDTLDVEGLERLLEHMIAGGVHGIFALGSTGEGPCLSYKLRIQLILEVCRIVNTAVGDIDYHAVIGDHSQRVLASHKDLPGLLEGPCLQGR